MPVTTSDLGAAVCRALMRDLDDKPVIMQAYNPANPVTPDEEWTTAADGQAIGQWCVILSVQPDKISVAARTSYWGVGRYNLAQLRPDKDDYFKDYLFIQYPDDPALITGPGYEAQLRAAIDTALTAAAADWLGIKAERAAGKPAGA